MGNPFDPYRDWLRIAGSSRPPTHYELLGLPAFEHDSRKVQAAATERISHVRKYQSGKHSDVAIRLMNEVSQALTCLTDPAAKAAYDRQLRGYSTLEDVASEALAKTRAEIADSKLTELPPLLEKLNAVVAATEPPPGSAGYVRSTTARLPPARKPKLRLAPVAAAAALAVMLLISSLGIYGLYRFVSDAERKRVVPRAAENQNPRPPPTQPLRAPPTVPPVALPGNALQAEAIGPTSTEPPTSPALLKPGVSGTWEGTLAEIYVDPGQPQAHLLLKLAEPPGQIVEAISNDFAAFLALFAFVSDGETGGQGDRLRIEGTAIENGPTLFAQRSEPLAIQLAALGPIAGPPAYRAGDAPGRPTGMKLKSPLAFLLRMRPQPRLVYEFPAVFASAIADPASGGSKVLITPGAPDMREVHVSMPDVLPPEIVFQPGDAITVQAEVRPDEPAPKLSLRGWHLRKTADPTVQIGMPRTSVVNVAKHMALAPSIVDALDINARKP